MGLVRTTHALTLATQRMSHSISLLSVSKRRFLRTHINHTVSKNEDLNSMRFLMWESSPSLLKTHILLTTWVKTVETETKCDH